MPSTRKRRVRSDGKLTLSKRPKTVKPQPADDVELISPPADIPERKDITGDVNDPDGCHEDVEGETVCHATDYSHPLEDDLANVT